MLIERCRDWRGVYQIFADHRQLYLFFFSSRRRHTRFDCDWSSDVCSSDLNREGVRCRLIFQFRPDGGQERFGKFAEVGVHSALDTSQKNQISDDEQYHENERSEEHTSELQSQSNLVCRLLLEKKKKNAETGKSRIKHNHNNIANIWMNGNIQLRDSQSTQLFARPITSNTRSYTARPQSLPSVG